MSEGFGLGDGMNDLSNMSGSTDAKLAEARRTQRHATDMGRWPSAATVVRVIAIGVAAIVVGGWLVTLITATR